MPLIAYALVAYLAGLLAGFSNSLTVCFAALSTAAVLGARSGRAVAVALVALSTAGIVAARETHRGDERCVLDAVRGPVLLILDDTASPGTYARARLAGCGVSASVSVERGEAAAGATVAARGAVTRTERGVQVQHATIELVRGPGPLQQWRATAGRAIGRTFRDDAPLVKALLIADRRDLSPEVRDRFAAAGLAHILAIAGLHIGIIAVAIGLALEVFGVPRPRAAAATIVILVIYVAIIGAPIPAVRSAAMLATLVATRLAQRPTARWSIVAIGAMHPVLDPGVVLNAGYQLSVVGVAAMIAAARLSKRIGVHRLPWLAKAVVVTLIATTVATIASAPIVAWVFGRVSIIAPLTNLAANPLIALAQPIVFCGLIFSPIGPVARLFADAAHPLLVGLDGVASIGAAAPGGAIQVAPTVFAAIVAGVLSIAVIVACASREWTRPAIVAAIAAATLAWMPVAPLRSGAGDVELHMIDVGQGDAIALRTPGAHWIVFDAGRAWRGGDAGRSTVIPYIGRHGGAVDVFVLSHPHTDHVGGAASLIHALHPATYIDGGFPGPADAYRASLEAARTEHVRWIRPHPRDSLTVDGVTITFLAPDSAWTASLVDPNLASVVALVRVGDIRMLLMGDAERPEENWLLQHGAGLLRADILKVGHHGSSTSSTEAFLDAVRPRLALVSVGAGNSYHLPTPSVMRALAAHGAQVLRTDHLGTIIARTDGHRVFIEAGGETWELPRQSSP